MTTAFTAALCGLEFKLLWNNVTNVSVLGERTNIVFEHCILLKISSESLQEMKGDMVATNDNRAK